MSTVEETYLVGLIGSGVLISLTPPLHEHEADALGLRYLYRPLDLDTIGRKPAEIGELLADGAALGYNAFNVTHPCKQEVLAAPRRHLARATAIGAVNTVLIHEGRLIGDNTDVSGFAAALSSGLARGRSGVRRPARRGWRRRRGRPRAASRRGRAARDRRYRPLPRRMIASRRDRLAIPMRSSRPSVPDALAGCCCRALPAW